MSLISISDLTFGYDGSFDNIFEHVSFQIDTDWKLGFIGRNGKGKTTFLNLLMGRYEYRGKISASVSFDYFPSDVGNPAKNTNDIMNEIIPDCPLWKIERELSLLNVSNDVFLRPFYTLSNGEQTKVLLAALFLKENHFLLIDEPTNHLDMEGRKAVSVYLNSKKGFILVSHDRAFLDGCIDHVLSINRQNIEIQKGNFTSWQANKTLQDNFELAENEKLKKEISRLEKTAKEKAVWSDTAESRKIGFDPDSTEKNMGRRAYQGAKSKKLMKRAKVIEARQQTAISEKSRLLKNIDTAENLIIRPIPYVKNTLIEISELSIFYGDKKACENISFSVNSSDRVVLSGKNGSGKSSILKLIMGENISYTGNISIGSNLIVSYVPQDASFLSGNLKDYAQEENIDESLFKTILRKLNFSRAQFEKDMEDFSGGQKKKVLLARSLCQSAHLYIWDEPLNFVDVLSRIQIEELIQKFSPTMLFVEHDSTFNNTIATKRVNLG